MLILSRLPGESIYIASADDECVITVLRVSTVAAAVSVLVNRTSARRPGKLVSRSYQVLKDATVKFDESSEMTLLDVREEKARLGINAPREFAVHRFEVYEALRDNKNSDDGPSGAPVPKPSSPMPPTLDTRLNEPRDDDDTVPPNA